MPDSEDEGVKRYELIPRGSDKPRTEPFKGSQKFTGHAKAKYVKEDEWGDVYEGQFNEGLRQGKGVYTFMKNGKSGDCYEGHYEENQKHGFGKMTYKKFEGDDDDADADPPPPPRSGTYLGHFSAGLRGAQAKTRGEADMANSDGTFTYHNGDVYVGQWRAGKKHGQGTYMYAKDETKLVGEWENGKITNGRWLFPNGMFYSGTFRYNKPCGKGVWVFKNGNQLTGEYVQKAMEVDEDGGGGGDEEEAGPKPDPKVWCYFKHGKNTAVRGGTMFQQLPVA